MKRVVATAAVVMAIVALASSGAAKDNKGKGQGANKSKVEKSIKSNGKAVPPGQIKRYTRGQKLPGDLSFDYIDDLDKWKLKPLGPGQRYIRVDDEILSISDDTKTVIEAVGIVGDLVK